MKDFVDVPDETVTQYYKNKLEMHLEEVSLDASPEEHLARIELVITKTAVDCGLPCLVPSRPRLSEPQRRWDSVFKGAGTDM